jgi:exoribonuclease R
MFKIHISDKSYKSWEIVDLVNFNLCKIEINPFESKLFTDDIFSVESNINTVTIHESKTREMSIIAGVLILEGNKTYGRENKKNNARLFYKCIPNDKRLPAFLVPYEIKNMGFSKKFKNLYVTFCFHEWKEKHPHGKLHNSIGPVDDLTNFYEYQLYCKNINISILNFQKEIYKAINKGNEINKVNEIEIIENIQNAHPTIQDRTSFRTFTIDPDNCSDYDDAFGLLDYGNNEYLLSIYISNVTIWLDFLNLWQFVTERVATIYLPDKKRSMLPTILSENLCSLQESKTRIAFTMDLLIKDEQIIDVKFLNCFIKVRKNFCYEEPLLLADKDYIQLLQLTRKLSLIDSGINYDVQDSHDVVAYLMILMNYYCSINLKNKHIGIFRKTMKREEETLEEQLFDNAEVSKFVKLLKTTYGEYVDCSTTVDTRHHILDVDSYIHITSPIRRIVDLLNMIQIQSSNNILHLSSHSKIFYETWISKLEYINNMMRNIKKIQTNCTILNMCNNNPALLDKEFDGYLFDKVQIKDDMYKYSVYISELKICSKVKTRENLANYICKKVQMYVFNDEESYTKKIQIQIKYIE